MNNVLGCCCTVYIHCFKAHMFVVCMTDAAVVLQVCTVNARAYESAINTSGNPAEDEDQFDHYLLLCNKQVCICACPCIYNSTGRAQAPHKAKIIIASTTVSCFDTLAMDYSRWLANLTLVLVSSDCENSEVCARALWCQASPAHAH